MAIEIGSRVKVFDHLLYENDITTPLEVTFKEATVHDIYTEKKCGKLPLKWKQPVADVIFDHRPDEISQGHFVSQMEEIQ